MFTRRETFLGISAVILATKVGRGEAVPRPTMFANDIWHQNASAKKFGDLLRSAVLKQIDGYYIGSRRTSITQTIVLKARYTMEYAQDISLGSKFPYEDLAWVLANEIAYELDAHRRCSMINLVALDGYMRIDHATFQPIVRFYIEHNV